jgi:DNA-binding response OmpR family regulator
MKHIILIVDDDALIISTLRKRLAGREIEVYTAQTSEEAKDIMGKVVPELLILDLLLTKEDGSQGTLDFMKSKENLQHVPILVLTNLDKPELKQFLLSQGVKEYLIKGTLSLDQLSEKVWGYLEPAKKP